MIVYIAVLKITEQTLHYNIDKHRNQIKHIRRFKHIHCSVKKSITVQKSIYNSISNEWLVCIQGGQTVYESALYRGVLCVNNELYKVRGWCICD